jgi:hypothetical protein
VYQVRCFKYFWCLLIICLLAAFFLFLLDLLGPDLHSESGSGSRRPIECGSIRIRIRSSTSWTSNISKVCADYPWAFEAIFETAFSPPCRDCFRANTLLWDCPISRWAVLQNKKLVNIVFSEDYIHRKILQYYTLQTCNCEPHTGMQYCICWYASCHLQICSWSKNISAVNLPFCTFFSQLAHEMCS